MRHSLILMILNIFFFALALKSWHCYCTANPIFEDSEWLPLLIYAISKYFAGISNYQPTFMLWCAQLSVSCIHPWTCKCTNWCWRYHSGLFIFIDTKIYTHLLLHCHGHPRAFTHTCCIYTWTDVQHIPIHPLHAHCHCMPLNFPVGVGLTDITSEMLPQCTSLNAYFRKSEPNPHHFQQNSGSRGHKAMTNL
jgi:hypothetical protein